LPTRFDAARANTIRHALSDTKDLLIIHISTVADVMFPTKVVAITFTFFVCDWTAICSNRSVTDLDKRTAWVESNRRIFRFRKCDMKRVYEGDAVGSQPPHAGHGNAYEANVGDGEDD